MQRLRSVYLCQGPSGIRSRSWVRTGTGSDAESWCCASKGSASFSSYKSRRAFKKCSEYGADTKLYQAKSILR